MQHAPLRRAIWACLAAAAMAAALTDCAGIRDRRDREERDAYVNVYPANYKAELLAFLRTYVNDPTNIRDASVAEPALKIVGSQNRYAVCVRFDAKNSDGRYAGSREGIAIYARGRFDQFIEQARDQPTDQVRDRCSQANYQRFPELEALKR